MPTGWKPAAVAAALIASSPAAVPAGPAPSAAPPIAAVVIPGERVFPESLTSTRDGTLYFGSLGENAIYRARPGAAVAEAWIPPGTAGVDGVLGVYADERAGVLWACSTKIDVRGVQPPADSALLAFDLATGAARGRYALPGAGAVCNDIATGTDGSVYVTDSTNMLVLRLARGAAALAAWAGSNGEFGATGDVLDGIAIVGRRVLVNAYRTGRLFAVPLLRDGRAGTVVPLELDRKLEMPDGMRSEGTETLLVAETGAGGRLARVHVRGARGWVETLASGYPDGAVAVTRTGEVAWVLEGQLARLFGTDVPAKPFRATSVAIGRPR